MTMRARDPELHPCKLSVDKAGHRRALAGALVLLGASVASTACAAVDQSDFNVSSTAGNTLNVESLGEFNQPWAMSFLPTGELLITEKGGQLLMVGAAGDGEAVKMQDATSDQLQRFAVAGLPDIRASGQGGLGDVIPHPDYSSNDLVYLSFVEREGDLSGAAVLRAKLDLSEAGNPKLAEQQVIWRQVPKVTGQGHYGHRLAFSQDGHLFVSSGERQKFDPAQDMEMNLGKVVRLNDDGSVPDNNPWASQGGVAAEFWSIGHRNPLGMAFDTDGQLWVHEMGPRGGDELNRVSEGANFGYPLVSNGRHYSGLPIPDHDTRPDLQAPQISWSPVISPAGFVIYSGQRYKDWQGTGLIGGLSSESLVRVSLGNSASEIERFDMNQRIREVEEDADGVVYLLEDGAGGRLLRLSMP